MDADTVPEHGSALASDGEQTSGSLGPALRRAWIGYQLRLDAAMEEAGFGERRFPDGRVLRLCGGGAGSTISAIGRELGMTRQGASKVVAHLSDRGYVTVTDSATSKREKAVQLTPRGADYLRTQRAAAQTVEEELKVVLGEAGFASLRTLLDALGERETTRLRAYLRHSVRE